MKEEDAVALAAGIGFVLGLVLMFCVHKMETQKLELELSFTKMEAKYQTHVVMHNSTVANLAKKYSYLDYAETYSNGKLAVLRLNVANGDVSYSYKDKAAAKMLQGK